MEPRINIKSCRKLISGTDEAQRSTRSVYMDQKIVSATPACILTLLMQHREVSTEDGRIAFKFQKSRRNSDLKRHEHHGCGTDL